MSSMPAFQLYSTNLYLKNWPNIFPFSELFPSFYWIAHKFSEFLRTYRALRERPTPSIVFPIVFNGICVFSHLIDCVHAILIIKQYCNNLFKVITNLMALSELIADIPDFFKLGVKFPIPDIFWVQFPIPDIFLVQFPIPDF